MTDTFEYDNFRLFERLPRHQIKRVLDQDMCDIDPEFLGFVDIYKRLSEIVPTHWTVIDLGCAYAPQAFLFERHKEYIGVNQGTQERFSAPNTTHYWMEIGAFIRDHASEFDQDTTFAICSYVPPWGGDNMKMARDAFKNVFTYYPAGGQEPVIRLGEKSATAADCPTEA